MRQRTLAVMCIVQLAAIAACDSGPAAPGRPLTVSIATPVSAVLVTRPGVEPPVWGVASAPVTIANPGTQPAEVATVETRAFNRTRAAVISTNVRPNEDFTYADTWVPSGGSLTLEAGVVVIPLPPPGDELRFEVIVTLRDGRTVRADAPLILAAA